MLKFCTLMAIAAIALPLSAHVRLHQPETITVDVSDRILLFRGKGYPVAIGDSDTPTPIGDYTVQWVGTMPDGTIAATFKPGAVGDRPGWYAIHSGGATGTTEGCIVLYNDDAAFIVRQIEVGDRVLISP